MATTKGIIGFQGTIDGISFYERKGKSCARKAGGPSKEEISTSKNCQRTRENNAEFKGAIATSKLLRQALNLFIKDFADLNISGRFNGIFRKVIDRGTGIRGERPVELLPNKDILVGFNLHKEISFDSIVQANVNSSINAERNGVRLTIPDFDISKMINAPAGSTHFRLINALTVVPKFVYDPLVKQYFRKDGSVVILRAHSYSGYRAIDENTGGDLVMVSALENSPDIDPESAVISLIGIEFYQKIVEVNYSLASNRCMKIVEVF